MDWTYHVKISTDSGSSISKSVQQLTTAQEQARDEFNKVNEATSNKKKPPPSDNNGLIKSFRYPLMSNLTIFLYFLK